MTATAVEVRDLRVELVGRGYDVVDEISIEIRPGEVLGLVGESGSGKTTVGMALLGHVRRGGKVGGGAVVIDGRDLAQLDAAGLRGLRGGTVAYIPQDPGTSLNPALRTPAGRATRSATRGCRRRSAKWPCRRTTASSRATRTSSPAVSSSASRSRWRSRAGRT
jgi:ABC-type glutathione transport system ATPase component